MSELTERCRECNGLGVKDWSYYQEFGPGGHAVIDVLVQCELCQGAKKVPVQEYPIIGPYRVDEIERIFHRRWGLRGLVFDGTDLKVVS